MGKKISHVFEFVFLYGFSLFVNLWPFSRLEILAKILVTAFYPLAGGAKRRIRNNLDMLQPEIKQLNTRAFVKANLEQAARTFLELMQSRKFRKPDFLKKYIHTKSEAVETFFDNPPVGIMCLQGHLGNWELPIAYYCQTRKVKLTAVLKKQSNPYVSELVEKRRRNYGANLVYIEDTSKIIRALRDKNVLGMAADQDGGWVGTYFIDFLGKPAATVQGPALLSYLTESKLCLLTCLYKGKGKYEIDIVPMLEQVKKKPGADKEEQLKELTTLWVKTLEKEVLKAPDQYFWLHRRWKSQPGS